MSVLLRIAQRWVVFAVAVGLWQLAAVAAGNRMFPPPSEIAVTAAQLWFSPVFGKHIVPGLSRLLLGWGIAAVVGIALGVLLGRAPLALRALGPLLNFLRSIPPPLLVPFFAAALEITTMQVPVIVFGSLWPVLLNTIDGAKGVDATKEDTARVFRLSRAQWLLRVVLPSALPKVFAGLRLSLSLALILMVISELVGSLNGIGNQLNLAKNDYNLPQMWAWIVSLGALGYLFNSLLLLLERRALAWQPRHSLEARAIATGG